MAIVKYLNPRNDIAFKKIFGTEKNKDILVYHWYQWHSVKCIFRNLLYMDYKSRYTDTNLLKK